MKPAYLLALLALAAACGDDDDPARLYDAPLTPAVDAQVTIDAAPPSYDALFTAGCSITLGGAASGNFPCAVTAGKNDDQSFSVFGLSSSVGNTSIVVTVAISGQLAVGEYAPVDILQGAASITIGIQDSFIAARGSDNDLGTLGPLELTDLDGLPPSGGVQVWRPHGSFTATLPSVVTGGTQATLSAEF